MLGLDCSASGGIGICWSALAGTHIWFAVTRMSKTKTGFYLRMTLDLVVYHHGLNQVTIGERHGCFTHKVQGPILAATG